MEKYIFLFLALSVLTIPASPQDERFPVTSAVHPSLLCAVNDLPNIRLRLGRKPYEHWWASAIQVAKAGPVQREKTEDIQLEYASRARHAAFCYLITGDEAFASIAIDRLQNLPEMKPRDMGGKSHLKLAQTGRDFAETYDILLPWLEAKHPDLRQPIADKLRYIGWELRYLGPNWYGLHKNNHGIRQFSALGLVALALRDDPEYATEMSDWLEYAIPNCLSHLRYQICSPDEGGYAEGFGYLNYAGAILWDFFYALKNVDGRNLWDEPDIRALHIYAARAQMPTGCWPMFDDASYGYFPCQIFCDAYPDDAGLFVDRHLARQSAFDAGYGELKKNGQRITPADDYILSLIHYDDAITPVPIVYPTLEVLEDAGDAVFRAGDGPDAIYLNMRIKGQQAALHGAGHNQPDPLSFFLQAYGENLLLDPGYISWEERDKVATSDNHNMITVDEQGPMRLPGNVSFEGFADVLSYGSDPQPYIEARTHYRNAVITRRIEFVDRKFFIVSDTASSDKPRTFTLNLHGHNDTKTDEIPQPIDEPITWEWGKAAVKCLVLCDADNVEKTMEADEHSFAYGEWRMHSAYRVKAYAQAVKFITIIIPFPKSEMEPALTLEAQEKTFTIILDGLQYEIN